MKETWTMVVSAASLLASWLTGPVHGFDPAWIAVVLCGFPIARSAWQELREERRVNSDLLVTLAIVAAVSINEMFAAGEVALIMMLGMWLEHRTVAKAATALEGMVEMMPRTARVKRDGEWREVSLSEVATGEVVLVKPGETVPVDGRIVAGQASFNQAALTGESLPVDKTIGDDVFVGTTNTNGVVEVEAVRVGDETTFAKVTRLVAEAMEKKAPVQRVLDRWAAWIVPASLALATLVYLVTGDVVRAVTILIVFCPCALVLATPTAIMAGIGSAAKQGILIKSGLALERIGQVNALLFDKTGTLTEGRLHVAEAIAFDGDERHLLRFAAALEQYSEHPLAAAVARAAAERGVEIPAAEDFVVRAGSGVSGHVDGRRVLVGNRRLLAEASVPFAEAEQWLGEREAKGQTGILVAVDGRVIGALAVADRVRREAKRTVSELRRIGVGELAIVTGDNRGAAAHLAGQVGISRVYAEHFPEAKYETIAAHKQQGQVVAMVGDGINDAPALTAADVGIAMGANGTQIAAQAADIVLMADDLSKVADAVRLGQKTLRVIHQNLWTSSAINLAAVLLAMSGWLGPVAGAFVHNATSVLVVANSARLISFFARPNDAKRQHLSCASCTTCGESCKFV